MYHVKLNNFTGPFDVLLTMLDEKKMDIRDVSLVAITDQFIQFIENQKTLNIANLADFLSVAANLLLLKSKAILPTLELEEDEEEDLELFREQLERCKRLQELSVFLRDFLKKQGCMFSREESKKILQGFYPPAKLTSEMLHRAFADVQREKQRFQEIEILPEESIQEIVSLEEKVQMLQSLIKRKKKNSFGDIVKDKSAIEIIVSFLALLELIKQDSIRTCQREMFGEIEFRRS